MRMWLAFVFSIGCVLAPHCAAAGNSMTVEPGLWEFRYAMPDPIGSQAGTQIHRTCLRDRTITAEKVMQKVKDCRIWNAVFQDPNVRWKMRCDTQAGPMSGSGSLKSNGSAVAGTLDMTMAVGGFEIPVYGEFKGRRIGNCR